MIVSPSIGNATTPELTDWDHFDIVALPEPWQVQKQAQFYKELFLRLYDL